jgi:carboxylesterase
MTVAVIPGGEPYFSSGGPCGVLLLHGLTGTTSSLLDLAQRCAAAGYTVSLPRLPGHGTSVEDMLTTDWQDWTGACDVAFEELAAQCDQVAVVALSMGGGIAVHLAALHPDITSFVFINPWIKHQGMEWEELAETLLASGVETYDSIGSDVKKEGVVETSYDQTPVAPALSALRATTDVNAKLCFITAPSLLFTSTEDHVVAVDNGDELVNKSNGPVERIWLENSFHVATLDNDRELIESTTMTFLAGHFAQ